MGFKTCSKCGGQLYVDHDSYGFYQSCIQCGKMVDLPDSYCVQTSQFAKHIGIKFEVKKEN